MRAARMYGYKQPLILEEIDKPGIKPGEVLAADLLVAQPTLSASPVAPSPTTTTWSPTATPAVAGTSAPIS